MSEENIQPACTYIPPSTDVFALRGRERMTFLGECYPVGDARRILGLQRRSVSFPPGDFRKIVDTPENEGEEVALEAIIACQATHDGWVWVHLSPSTKEVLGMLLERWGTSVDVWCFVAFENVTSDEQST